MVQAMVTYCLGVALDSLFGATSDPLFVTASAGPGYAWEGQSCTPRLAFTSTGPWGRSANVPRHPEIHLYLSLCASCLVDSVTERALVSI